MADVRMCGFERRTSVAAALEQLRGRLDPLGSETVPIRETAGRVVANDVMAACDVPHFARSMMDGYAVVAESTLGASELRPQRLAIVGEIRAGGVLQLSAPLSAGQAVRITTGAPLPAGADAVVMAEHTQPDSDEGVLVTAPISPHKHVGAIGEDIATGARILPAGRRLRPQDAGVAASTGLGELTVLRRPRVRILTTGNELLEPGRMPNGSRIVDSNSVVLEALAARDGAASVLVERLGDDRDAMGAAMVAPAGDVLLVSGGSSVGPEDHAPNVLAELGELTVHGVAMRPSSPAGFGFIEVSDDRGGDGGRKQRPVFLLPGNPVSCLCAYEFFAGPAIRRIGGLPWSWPHRRRRLPVAAKLVSVLGRTDYMRVTIKDRGVHPVMTSGASLLSSTTVADGAVIIGDECEGHAEGDLVEVLLYEP